MTSGKRRIAAEDILPIEEFGRIRAEKRRRLVAMKQDRRLEVGPIATFHFESYETMWMQIHEMLFIEKGGAAQIPGELEAYNPLIPDGTELVATMLLEIPDPDRRARLLARLGHIEDKVSLEFAGETVPGAPEGDLDRTNEEGKTSSVHFLHFRFTPAQIAKFKTPGAKVRLVIDHPEYGHAATLSEATRAALASDFA